ncbi:hypothetical protein PtA15_9A13 [Puccinia triticina]|uniref:Secreted protein n=1 Tax=Puccinia triticina TaxID=208348 RepID=A0ABY7CRP8_9BASI|nr:uncharacterized protein PtA15_9A13 [Puccinia triticina]WAQ87889.1 hypothetical protein PtA15_9A13 [Puccinia triticina]WAR60076.1 hypothetical protein PtB15_9B13 [Puccinia triticina]
MLKRLLLLILFGQSLAMYCHPGSSAPIFYGRVDNSATRPGELPVVAQLVKSSEGGTTSYFPKTHGVDQVSQERRNVNLDDSDCLLDLLEQGLANEIQIRQEVQKNFAKLTPKVDGNRWPSTLDFCDWFSRTGCAEGITRDTEAAYPGNSVYKSTLNKYNYPPPGIPVSEQP